MLLDLTPLKQPQTTSCLEHLPVKVIYIADLIGTFAFCITGIIGGMHHTIAVLTRMKYSSSLL